MIVAGDNPADEPKNCSSAGAESFAGNPCKDNSGSASAILGDLGVHAHKIAEVLRYFVFVSPSSGATMNN